MGAQDWMLVQAFVEMEGGRLLHLGLCEIGKARHELIVSI